MLLLLTIIINKERVTKLGNLPNINHKYCDVCGKMFNTYSKLKMHIIPIHRRNQYLNDVEIESTDELRSNIDEFSTPEEENTTKENSEPEENVIAKADAEKKTKRCPGTV